RHAPLVPDRPAAGAPHLRVRPDRYGRAADGDGACRRRRHRRRDRVRDQQRRGPGRRTRRRRGGRGRRRRRAHRRHLRPEHGVGAGVPSGDGDLRRARRRRRNRGARGHRQPATAHRGREVPGRTVRRRTGTCSRDVLTALVPFEGSTMLIFDFGTRQELQLLAFGPGVPKVTMPPEVVLVGILPPLLYQAAYATGLRELRRNLRPISLLAVGLVLLTTCGVAVVAHAITDLGWAEAFVLGAVVS